MPEHKLKFYGIWIDRFIAFRGGDEGLPINGKDLEAFSRSLAGSCQDWQIRQAGDAVRLYLFSLQQEEEKTKITDKATTDVGVLAEKMRRVIRLKHLALATEKTYLGWLRQFLAWCGDCAASDLDNSRVVAFLTHLAIEKRISKATQSQAFNALLFFYRN